jgi:hypothetical protein
LLAGAGAFFFYTTFFSSFVTLVAAGLLDPTEAAAAFLLDGADFFYSFEFLSAFFLSAGFLATAFLSSFLATGFSAFLGEGLDLAAVLAGAFFFSSFLGGAGVAALAGGACFLGA